MIVTGRADLFELKTEKAHMPGQTGLHHSVTVMNIMMPGHGRGP